MFQAGIWTCLKDIHDPRLRDLAKELPGMALSSRANGTVHNYLTAFDRWRRWAADFDEISFLPAQPKFVALYLSDLSKTCKTHAPISMAFYAIGWVHRTAGLDDPTIHQLPRLVRDSAIRKLGKGHNKKQPISVHDLYKIVKKCSGAKVSLYDLRSVTLCVLAFAGFLRFDELSHIRYSDIEFYETYFRIFIEKSKTDVYRDGTWIYVAKTYTVCCPFTILSRYLKLAKFKKSCDKFIFRSLSYFKTCNEHRLRPADRAITYTCTRDIVLKLFKSVGLNSCNFGTHSLRAGGATAAAENHVSDRLFKKHGRWRSEKVKDAYVKENLEQLLSVSLNLGI